MGGHLGDRVASSNTNTVFTSTSASGNLIGACDTSNNASLPVTSVDTIGSSSGAGFGVPDANPDIVFPNLPNVARDLGV